MTMMRMMTMMSFMPPSIRSGGLNVRLQLIRHQSSRCSGVAFSLIDLTFWAFFGGEFLNLWEFFRGEVLNWKAVVRISCDVRRENEDNRQDDRGCLQYGEGLHRDACSGPH